MNALNEPNITFMPNFIVNPQDLFELIENTTNWDNRLSVRKTASFGVAYEYSNLSYPKTTMPDWSLPIIEQIADKFGFLPNNCLINYYKNGQNEMGFHSDDISQMYENTGVVIISLGAEREIVYRQKTNKNNEYRYLLTKGSLLYMDDKVQEDWLHAIPMDNTTTPRMSLTFRKLLSS
ncbi:MULTISPECIES: alpha-ketoglutarate-dependent dioxygenase AlkB [Moraxella]|uniref:Fe2OG dioxygenase domain-containing protein n=1 Tax=Moraxella lacunata TaxID=477 RepID=A0A1B8Q816_MORLA|nr:MULTISPECIES: alpha-ketoglutarate-dependent dioxygenase AlkB [Moraxella]MBE9579489.1 alpha-ketoglutarate-dependent dioxygenase AlkB [Moraxella sp. K1664]MBE9588854.1 alpha-ketoglutarate-dependent dioxygenase AlkB [Moraxella sp. K1630]MBE9597066.1 alpha-ketoglutarate-dependent dioxygenase AlkB [Moraxella sp. K2450]MDH9219645.1 alpha-ketoglutarate-dependent dioxygenase AlkB [Moraxella lacunata]MDI4483587.1 alpha-ketoglutarate-dependent dioxygenase AlkB [Moraxella lacunata]